MVQTAVYARYLREHPDVLSDVLVRLLSQAPSWGVREKKTPRRRRSPAGETVPYPIDELPAELSRGALIATIVDMANRDEEAFLSLVMLGLVSKGMREEVRRQIIALETRLDVVRLYTRAAFDFFGWDGPTFELFLARLRIYAPATYRAWLYIWRTESIREKAQRLVTHVRDEMDNTVFDDYAAWLCDGEDPLATMAAFHYAVGRSPARRSSPFTREEILQLLPMTFNKELAVVLQRPRATKCEALNTFEFVRLTTLRCRRDQLLGYEHPDEVFQMVNIYIRSGLVPRGPPEGFFLQTVFRNRFGNECDKREMFTLVDTLWETLGEEKSLELISTLFEFASGMVQELQLSRWIKLAFCQRAFGDAYASLKSVAVSGLDQVFVDVARVLFKDKKWSQLALFKNVRRAFYRALTYRSLPPSEVFAFCFNVLAKMEGNLTNIVDKDVSFLYWAIRRGNEALTEFWVTQRWSDLSAALQARAPDQLPSNWTILEPLLDARLIERYDASGSLQHRLYLLLERTYFQRFPVVISNGRIVVTEDVPTGRYLLGPALCAAFETIAPTPPDAIVYLLSNEEILKQFGRVLDLRMMQQAYKFFKEDVTDLHPDRRNPLEFWPRAFTVMLTTKLPSATARSVASALLRSPELPPECFDLLGEVTPYLSSDALWRCFRDPRGLAFLQKCFKANKEGPLAAIMRCIDNPLVFLGRLRCHVNVRNRAYTEVVATLLFRILVWSTPQAPTRDIMFFCARNALMPFFDDDKLPIPTDDDVFRALGLPEESTSFDQIESAKESLLRGITTSELLEGRSLDLLFVEPFRRLVEVTKNLGHV